MTADHSDGRPAPSRVPTISLGRGRVVPYPQPADDAATKFGKANRRADTKPEVRLRAALHRRGLRYRKDHLVRAGDCSVRVDVVFSGSRLAVFVDGCFWHSCPVHQRIPTRNQDYWTAKLQANTERDRRVDDALKAAGWDVERIWEHDDPEVAARHIEALIRNQRHRTAR